MPQPHDVSGRCPICDTAMTVTRLTCGACGTTLEGSFHVSGVTAAPRGGSPAQRADAEARFGRLARLDAQQLEFVETFLRCRGVIKNVEDMLGISYPTVKARLGNVLDALGFAPEEELPVAERRARRREILADLAAGRITTEEAHQLLARNQPAIDEDDGDTN